MALITPTVSDFRFGPEAWDFLDYYENPVRETGGNPVLLVRNGGGNAVGNYQDSRNDGMNTFFHLPQFLAGVPVGTNPPEHWDVCAFQSAQRSYISATPPFKRSKAMTLPAIVFDCQRAIALVKRALAQFGGDHTRTIGLGVSAGSTVLALSQLMPPRPAVGNRRVASDPKRPTFDSSLRGVFFDRGQVDFRKINGVNYLNPAGIGGFFGRRIDTTDEFDAISQEAMAAVSIRAYFEALETQTYPAGKGFFVSYAGPAGAHVLPMGVHDSQQYQDLIDAIAGAGLPYGEDLHGGQDGVNVNYPNAATGATLAFFEKAAQWAGEQIGAR